MNLKDAMYSTTLVVIIAHVRDAAKEASASTRLLRNNVLEKDCSCETSHKNITQSWAKSKKIGKHRHVGLFEKFRFW
jgi:hypothetical protein